MHRLRISLFLSPCFVLSVLSALAACRDTAKDDAPTQVAPAPPPASVAVAVSPALVDASSTPDPDDRAEIGDAEADAAADGGARKRRRLLPAAADAGQVDTAPPPLAPPVRSAEPVRGKRPPPSPMDNDQVYGAPSSTRPAGLQKAPLPAEDPWKKPAPPASP